MYKYTLTKTNLIKIGRGALIAGAGAICVYLADVIPTIDFEGYTVLATFMASVLANAAKEFVSDR